LEFWRAFACTRSRREVARTILFLASAESGFTTGAEFLVNGGLTAT
jgi:NAD(P)-dependent dehydrogenase (short-subunit alcohol dehydrogenase family)